MSAQQPAPARFTLNDLLNLNLPPHARATIYRELRSHGLKQTRLACRSLRFLIDEHADELCLRAWCLDSDTLARQNVPLAWMEALCTSWHQRWPRASKLTLELLDNGEGMASCLPRPFAIAPPAAFQRLTHLIVKGDDGVYASVASLSELLQRVPGVQTLALEDLYWGSEDSGPDGEALASSAFSSLTRLKHLTLTDYNWLPCIQPGLAAQLRTLRVGNGPQPLEEQITEDEVARAVAYMTALEELVLDEDLYYSDEGLRAVLDALSPSVRRLTVVHVLLEGRGACVTAACTLAGGKLLSVEMSSNQRTQDVHVEDLAALLEAALLPSRVLGPRLPLLSVPLTLFADEETSAALAGLSPGIRRLADRCDGLHFFSLCAPGDGTVSLEDIMAIARVLGVPEELEWGEHPSLELLPPRSPAAAGTASRGSGSEARRLSSGSPALTPAQAAPRVVERAMRKAMGGPAVGSHLLLFGPAVSSRLVFPRELRGWVAELIAKAAESLQPQKARMKPIVRFRPVPSFGAVELSCRSDLAAAVAEAGRRAGAAVLTAGCSLETALAQVLQALWSGEEAGGPGADVGELERFRWLLETMEAAAALLPAVERL